MIAADQKSLAIVDIVNAGQGQRKEVNEKEPNGEASQRNQMWR